MTRSRNRAAFTHQLHIGHFVVRLLDSYVLVVSPPVGACEGTAHPALAPGPCSAPQSRNHFPTRPWISSRGGGFKGQTEHQEGSQTDLPGLPPKTVSMFR